MNTIVKSLKALTTKLGGTDTTSKTVVDALKKVFSAYGGTGSTAKTISGAIDEIATVAVATPSGKLSITGTSEVNCASYATAQVSSNTLIAENIKKDVSILGVTGSYEGGGSSDFSTAEVTFVNNTGASSFANIPICVEENALGEGSPAMVYYLVATPDATPVVENVPLYKGSCYGRWDTNENQFEISVSGDAVLAGEGTVLITGDCTITLY